MKSTADYCEEYLDGLSPERREAVSAVRQAVLSNLPNGYEEIMDFGMIAYVVPLARVPKTYNGHPLMYAAISSEKNYVSVHLMNVYADPETTQWFVERLQGHWQEAGHGQVVRPVQEAGRPATGPDRRGGGPNSDGRVDCPLRSLTSSKEAR